jgi:hypothetical protein
MNQSEALALLNSLGDTPEQVADSLLAQKIKGIPGSTADCPISNCLRSHGAIYAITWGRDGIVVSSYPKEGHIEDVFFIEPPLISKSIKQFIVMFDANKFPNLEDK